MITISSTSPAASAPGLTSPGLDGTATPGAASLPGEDGPVGATSPFDRLFRDLASLAAGGQPATIPGVAAKDVPLDPSVPCDPAAVDPAALTAKGPALPGDPTSPTLARETESSTKELTDATTDAPSPAADLAAQLALVSQWAALGPQAAATTTPTPPTSPEGEVGRFADGVAAPVAPAAPDLRAQLDAVRGAPVAAATTPVDPKAIDAKAVDTTTMPVDTPVDAIAADLARLSGDRPADATRTAKPDAPVDREGKGDRKGERTAAVGAATTLHKALVPDALQPILNNERSRDDGASTGGTPGGAFAALAAEAAAKMGGTATTAPTATVVANQILQQPVGTPAWQQELGTTTLHFATAKLESASLHLNPEHLGPMQVEVRMDDGVANLSFHAAHAETRQAIEASRPMLEQMFAAQGLSVGDCAVNDQPRGGSGAAFDAQQAADGSRQGGGQRHAYPGEAREVDTGARTITIRPTRADGLVDLFA